MPENRTQNSNRKADMLLKKSIYFEYFLIKFLVFFFNFIVEIKKKQEFTLIT